VPQQLTKHPVPLLSNCDCCSSAGGHIASLDVLPAKGPEATAARYLAVSSYLASPPADAFGVVQSGAGMIQIWEAATHLAEGGKEATVLKFLYGIVHDGLIADPVTWCPTPDASDAREGDTGHPHRRLGLLACALVDGTVPIYALPQDMVAMTQSYDLPTGAHSTHWHHAARLSQRSACAATCRLALAAAASCACQTRSGHCRGGR
jgi:hypothetical protein